MFKLIKEVLIELLSFSGSLATKYMSLNNGPCFTTLIYLNSVELNCCPFMFSLDLNKLLLSKTICFIQLLKEWTTTNAPLKTSPYMKEWMAQADPPKEA